GLTITLQQDLSLQPDSITMKDMPEILDKNFVKSTHRVACQWQCTRNKGTADIMKGTKVVRDLHDQGLRWDMQDAVDKTVGMESNMKGIDPVMNSGITSSQHGEDQPVVGEWFFFLFFKKKSCHK